MLGIDPLEIGNEGKVLIGVVPQKAEEVLATLQETKEGKNAAIIGEATDNFSEVVLETVVGGKRIMAPPVGDPIPRIC
jgi:hydrogenase expression/formation protein HypE